MPIYTMVDLETMGSGPDAAICSIGAIKFDPDGSPDDDKEFYRHVDLRMWWMAQSGPARSAIIKPHDASHINGALFDFDVFYAGSQGVWAAPSVFDIPILENAFKRNEYDIPWKVGEIHCWSTVRKLLKISKAPNPNAHHALADARAQVVEFRQGWHMLKKLHAKTP